MALNPTTTSYSFRDRWNDCLVRRFTLTGPAAYVTGGIAITNVSDFGWGETQTLTGTLWNGTTYVQAVLDYANQKVLFFVPNTGVEVANGASLAAYSGQMLATGK